MNRFLIAQIAFACTLSLMTEKSVAGWITIIGQGTDSTFSVENVAYLRKGNLRQFWAVSNTPEKQDTKSGVLLYEADCVKTTLRVLYLRMHREQSGNGAIAGESNIPFDTPVRDAEKKVISFICAL